MESPKGGLPKAVAKIPRMTLEGTLPESGRKIVMIELTGADELAVASEATEGTILGNTRGLWASIMRSLRSIDGQKFDASEHTPESTRECFSSREWRYLIAAFNKLHIPTNQEHEKFEATFRNSAE